MKSMGIDIRQKGIPECKENYIYVQLPSET